MIYDLGFRVLNYKFGNFLNKTSGKTRKKTLATNRTIKKCIIHVLQQLNEQLL